MLTVFKNISAGQERLNSLSLFQIEKNQLIVVEQVIHEFNNSMSVSGCRLVIA